MAVVSSIAAFGQTTYERAEYLSQRGDTLRYRFLAPETIETGKTYPLVLFLHGSGERGADNEKQLTHGAQMWLNPVVREQYRAFVVIPQCPSGHRWSYGKNSEGVSVLDSVTPTLLEMVDAFSADNAVDTTRVYIMGLSMGGIATYELASLYPSRWAAAIPICGWPKEDILPQAAGIPFRIYHGDADPAVGVEGSRKAYRILRKAGATPVYHEYPGVEHNSWNNAFNDPELLPWMFAQKKTAD